MRAMMVTASGHCRFRRWWCMPESVGAERASPALSEMCGLDSHPRSRLPAGRGGAGILLDAAQACHLVLCPELGFLGELDRQAGRDPRRPG
jgi:hypothetical protein